MFDQFKNEVIDLSSFNNLRSLKIASNSYENISECLTDFKFNLNENQRNIKFEIKMTNASASLSDFFDLISAYQFHDIKAKFKVILIDNNNKLSEMLLQPSVLKDENRS